MTEKEAIKRWCPMVRNVDLDDARVNGITCSGNTVTWEKGSKRVPNTERVRRRASFLRQKPLRLIPARLDPFVSI